MKTIWIQMGGAYLVTWTVLCFHCVTFKQLLNCVFHDLRPSQPRPFAQIKLDTSAHAQIFTAQGISSGTEALNIVSNHCVCILWDVVTWSDVFTLQHVLTLIGAILLPAKCWFALRLGMAYCMYACRPTMDLNTLHSAMKTKEWLGEVCTPLTEAPSV